MRTDWFFEEDDGVSGDTSTHSNSAESEKDDKNLDPDSDGAVKIDNPGALVRAYEEVKKKEKEQREQAKRLASELDALEKSLKGIDRSELERLKQLDKEAQKEEMARQKRFDEYRQQAEQETAAQRERIHELETSLTNIQLTYALENAFYKAGGKNGHFEAVKPALLPLTELDENGEVKFHRKDGTRPYDKDGKPTKIEAWLRDEFASDDSIYSVHFEPLNRNSGTGAPQSLDRSRVIKNSSREELMALPPMARVAAARNLGMTT